MNVSIFYEFIRKNFFNRLCLPALIFVNGGCLAAAQPIDYQSDNISTVLFAPKGSPFELPMVKLGSQVPLLLQFDEMEADTRTLYVTFTHCNAQWQPSDLMDVDIVDGFNKFYGLEEARFSFNTKAYYVHYDLTVDVSVLKLSGNYVLSVYADDDGGRLLLQRPFLLYEDAVGIRTRVDGDGAAGYGTQRLSFCVAHPQLKVQNPHVELKAAVWQNHRPDTWRMVGSPQFVRADELVFDNPSVLTFEAGNEARWIDNRDLKYPPANVASIVYSDPYYHFELQPDAVPQGYAFYEDFNGGRHIEARHVVGDACVVADYTLVHFAMPSSRYVGEVYVWGAIFDYRLATANRMIYNYELGAYTLTAMVKQGLHNYQYLRVPDGAEPEMGTFEGSFAEAENDYYVAVYYRSYSDTYDRLVGVRKHNTLRNLNAFIH